MTMSVTLLQRTFYARAAILMAIQFAGASDERRVRCRTGYKSRKIDRKNLVTKSPQACHILDGLGCVLGWGWCRIDSGKCFHVGADLGARSRAGALSTAV